MKFITNFFKKLFNKTEKNIEDREIDIKIEILDPIKNVEIYQEIRKDHEESQVELAPKKRKPAKPRAKKAEVTKPAEASKKTPGRKKSE
jgi:hypothetical protein